MNPPTIPPQAQRRPLDRTLVADEQLRPIAPSAEPTVPTHWQGVGAGPHGRPAHGTVYRSRNSRSPLRRFATHVLYGAIVGALALAAACIGAVGAVEYHIRK